MPEAIFQLYTSYTEYPVEEMRQRSADFLKELQRRRTVRHFSDRPVPREIIEYRTSAGLPGYSAGALRLYHRGMIQITVNGPRSGSSSRSPWPT